MSAREIVESRIASKLKEHAGAAAAIAKKVVLELTGADGGRWLLDCC